VFTVRYESSGGLLPAPTWGNFWWYNPSGFAVRLKHIRVLLINRFTVILMVSFSLTSRYYPGVSTQLSAAAALV